MKERMNDRKNGHFILLFFNPQSDSEIDKERKLFNIFINTVGSPYLSEISSVPYRIVPYRTLAYRTVPYRTLAYRTVTDRLSF